MRYPISRPKQTAGQSNEKDVELNSTPRGGRPAYRRKSDRGSLPVGVATRVHRVPGSHTNALFGRALGPDMAPVKDSIVSPALSPAFCAASSTLVMVGSS